MQCMKLLSYQFFKGWVNGLLLPYISIVEGNLFTVKTNILNNLEWGKPYCLCITWQGIEQYWHWIYDEMQLTMNTAIFAIHNHHNTHLLARVNVTSSKYKGHNKPDMILAACHEALHEHTQTKRMQCNTKHRCRGPTCWWWGGSWRIGTRPRSAARWRSSCRSVSSAAWGTGLRSAGTPSCSPGPVIHGGQDSATLLTMWQLANGTFLLRRKFGPIHGEGAGQSKIHLEPFSLFSFLFHGRITFGTLRSLLCADGIRLGAFFFAPKELPTSFCGSTALNMIKGTLELYEWLAKNALWKLEAGEKSPEQLRFQPVNHPKKPNDLVLCKAKCDAETRVLHYLCSDCTCELEDVQANVQEGLKDQRKQRSTN